MKKPNFEIDQVEYLKLKINFQLLQKYQKNNTYKEGVSEYKDDKGNLVVINNIQWQNDPNNNHQEEQKDKYLKSFDREYKMLIFLNKKYPNQFPFCQGWTENLTQQGNHRYAIMERADMSLKQFLSEQRNNLSRNQRHLLMKQIWDILKNLQKEGISHRNLKTEQFLVFQTSECPLIKLTDFGSFSRRSKYLDSQVSEIQSQIFLTPPTCLSPELNKITELTVKNQQDSKFSLLQKVIKKLKDTIKNNDKQNLNRIIQLIWHQFDSYAVGLILLDIFGNGVSESCEQNLEDLKELLINCKSEKEKQWILRMLLLLQRSPQHRLTIEQIDKIESQVEQDFLQNVKGTWKDIFYYLSEQGIHMSPYFQCNDNQNQEVEGYIRTLKQSFKIISQKSADVELNQNINIGIQKRHIVEEHKQQQASQQQQNIQQVLQMDPSVSDDPLILLLAQVIYNAGRGEGKQGFEMVASTILNRYKLNRKYLGGQNFEVIIDNANGYRQQMKQISDLDKKIDGYKFCLTLARQLVKNEFKDTTGVGATHFTNKIDGFKRMNKDLFSYEKQLGALFLFREH